MKTNRKTYICPELNTTDYKYPILQVPESLPQGNGDDPIIDDENDELSKERKSGWGSLW